MRERPTVNPSRSMAVVPATLVLLIAALNAAGFQDSEDSQESGMKVARLMRTCERCHLDVWEEWQSSGHSRSWTNPAFQAAIVGREDGGEACASCHAPDSVLRVGPGSLPKPRSTDRELGVNCVTCHVDGRTYYGPVPSRGHGEVVVMEDYRSSRWCSSCHGHAEIAAHSEHYSSYVTSPAGEAGRSCQACHMPAVVRELVKAKRPLKDIQPAVPCRMHRFGVEPDEAGRLKDAAQLQAVFEEEQIALEVRPHDGHRIGHGFGRMVVLEVRLFDESGTLLDDVSHEFAQEGDERLQPGQGTWLRFDAPASAVRAEAELRLLGQDTGSTPRRTLLLAEVTADRDS
jgi:hypothetical protein